MRRLALTGRGVHVGGQAARRRRAGQQFAVVGAADGDRAAGQVRQHRRARQRGLARSAGPAPTCPRRSRRAARSPGRSAAANSRSGPNGTSASADAIVAAHVVAGGHLAALVELAVGGQIRLRHHAQHRTAVNHHRGVVDPVAVAQRGADDQHRQQVGRRGHQDVHGALRRRRAARPAAGCPRSSSPTASARETPPAPRRRRGIRAPAASTDSALAAGSADRGVHGCTRPPARTRAGRRSRSSRPNCGKPPTLGTVNGHPRCAEAPELVAVLAGRRVAVLTGAGLSTDSGIPDYRGPDSPPSNPMTIRQFTSDPVFRQRYWARNHVGWRHMDATLPNAGHRALADLERAGVVSGVITQNVDLLHTKAGSANVVNLHGTYARVVCLALWPHDDPRGTRGRTRGAQPGLPRTRRSGRRDRGGARRRRDGQRNRVLPIRRLPVVRRDAQARHRLLRRECRQSRCRAGLFTCRRVRMHCWSPGRR